MKVSFYAQKSTLCSGLKHIAVYTLLFSLLLLSSCYKNPGALVPEPEKLVDLNSWMKSIPNHTQISAVSIPGTHDAGATIEYFPATSKCQDIGIDSQLNIGVRYLDIRCRHINNAFTIHHGIIYQKLHFQDVVKMCLNFLKANPSETILMSIKEEHTPANNTQSFEQTFDEYVQQNPSKWDLSDGFNTLGSLRGKIKLLRRFGSNSVKGIDAKNWGDNRTFEINNNFGNIKIQDYYRVVDVAVKWNKIESLLKESKNDRSDKLYLNYTSGFKPIIGIPNITEVANYINPKINQYFSDYKKGKYGIIVMDFIDENKSRWVVNSNF